MATNGRSNSARHRVHVGGLRQRLGQRVEIDVEESFPGLQVIASRTTDTPVTGTLTIESIERGVSVTGTITVEWEAECRRCLDDIQGHSHPFVDEIFQFSAPADSDVIDFDGETVVLDEILRDNAMAALPLSPLCGPDCMGPDPERFPPGLEGVPPEDPDQRAEEISSAPTETTLADPRWAALDDLDLR